MMIGLLRKKMEAGQLPVQKLINFIFDDDSVQRVYFLSPVVYSTLKQSGAHFDPDVVLIDGFSLVAVLNRRWGTKLQRYSFDSGSLAPFVFEEASKRELSVAIIGAKDTENEAYCSQLRAQYPKLTIALSHSGYFSDASRRDLFARLEMLVPDVIIVGLGSPAQEEFGHQIKLKPGQKLFTCGAHITQSAGGWQYYPELINKLHLRWLYRLIMEPHTRKRVPKILRGLFEAWRDAKTTG